MKQNRYRTSPSGTFHKLSTKRSRRLMSLLLAVALLVCQVPALIADAVSDENRPAIWTPDNLAYENGELELSKEVTGQRGSQAEENLVYDLKLGVLAKSNPMHVPSDIVLVLDRSGSMANNYVLSSSVSRVDTRKTYWIYYNGSQKEVTYSNRAWKVKGTNTTVYFEEGGTGSNSRYQFYASRITRMEALQNAAGAFVKQVAELNADNRVALVSFASDYDGAKQVTHHTNNRKDFYPLARASDADAVTNIIDGLVAKGGTFTDKGLEKAEEILERNNSEEDLKRNRVVILFTDGAPSGGMSGPSTTNWEKGTDSDVIKEANAAAQKLKRSLATGGCGAAVFTVGVFGALSDDFEKHLPAFMKGLASKDENYLRSENADDLLSMFEGLVTSTGIDLTDATVRDYIDPQFKPVRPDGTEIKNGETYNGATYYLDSNGNWYVEWPADIEKMVNNTKWKYYETSVSPKGTDLSGDNLPTNVGGISALYTKDNDKSWAFPEPHVNIPISISKVLHQTKTAKVHAGEPEENPNRLYDITLNLWGNPQESTSTGLGDANIMLVLDMSSSMRRGNSDIVATSYDELSKLEKNKVYSLCKKTSSGLEQVIGPYSYVRLSYSEYGSYYQRGWNLEEMDVNGYAYGASYNWSNNYNAYNPYKLVGDGGNYVVCETRITGLKETAAAFVDSLMQSESNITLGITTFANSSALALNFTDVNEGNRSTLQRSINALNPVGNTQVDLGVQTAKEAFERYKRQNPSDNKRNITLVITDGEPFPASGNDSASLKYEIAQNANSYASAMKNSGIELYTTWIGSGDVTISGSYSAFDFLQELCSAPAEDHFLIAETADDLLAALEKSVSSSSDAPYEGITVRDYIDPRFEPVDQYGNPLTETTTINGARYSKDSEGNWLVEWVGQSIPARSEKNPNAGWKKTITVRAKDAYIGGNDIPTNVPGKSGAYMDGEDYGQNAQVPFDKPTVNVPVRFDVTDDETTIFLGDEAPAPDYNKMFDPDHVKYNGTELNPEWIDGEFSYHWYLSDAQGNPVGDPIATGRDFPQGLYPNSDVRYALQVTYTPASSPNAGTVQQNGGGLVVGPVSENGVYTVYVKAGSLTLEKGMELPDDLDLTDEAFRTTKPYCQTAFIFQVRGDMNFDVTLRYDDQGNDSKTLKNLKRGTYSVKEVIPADYEQVTVYIDGVECTPDTKISIGPESSHHTVRIVNKLTNTGYNHQTSEVTNKAVAVVPAP